MNPYTDISNGLKNGLSSSSIFRVLLPIDMVFLFGGLIIMALGSIFGINFGDIISSLAYWAFILGLLLTFANMHEQFLYIGLLGYGALCAIALILNLLRPGHFFQWSSLFSAIIFGYLGYLVFKKTVIRQ